MDNQLNYNRGIFYMPRLTDYELHRLIMLGAPPSVSVTFGYLVYSLVTKERERREASKRLGVEQEAEPLTTSGMPWAYPEDIGNLMHDIAFWLHMPQTPAIYELLEFLENHYRGLAGFYCQKLPWKAPEGVEVL